MTYDELKLKLDQMVHPAFPNPRIVVNINLELSGRSALSFDLELQDIEFCDEGKEKVIRLKF